MVIYGHFWGKKSRFLDFFQIAWVLFKNRLGIVFGLKSPLLDVFSAQQALNLFLPLYRPSPLGSRGSPTQHRQGFPGLFILRTKTSLNTVSSNFVTETKHTLANFFLRHSYLISTFLLFYSLNLKTTEEEYAVFFKSRPSEIIVRIEGRKTVNC